MAGNRTFAMHFGYLSQGGEIFGCRSDDRTQEQARRGSAHDGCYVCLYIYKGEVK